MPGNIVTINNSKELEWYVGDSKMPQVIDCLNEIGIQEKDEKDDPTRLQKDKKR